MRQASPLRRFTPSASDSMLARRSLHQRSILCSTRSLTTTASTMSESKTVGPMCELQQLAFCRSPSADALLSDRFEAGLPSLPVPTLEETADRYLTSIKTFHTAQAPGTPSTPLPSFAASEAAVAEFRTSPLVAELQQRLQQRAAEKPSWLSEWWNSTGEFPTLPLPSEAHKRDVPCL